VTASEPPAAEKPIELAKNGAWPLLKRLNRELESGQRLPPRGDR